MELVKELLANSHIKQGLQMEQPTILHAKMIQSNQADIWEHITLFMASKNVQAELVMEFLAHPQININQSIIIEPWSYSSYMNLTRQLWMCKELLNHFPVSIFRHNIKGVAPFVDLP